MRAVAILFTAFIAPACAQAQEAAEVTLMKAVFGELNPRSIRADTEFCGYVGYDANGHLAVSRAARGDEESCMPDDPDNLETIIASYHTHGAYSPDYYNEVPSGEDMESDEAEGIDGWVATPGGRLWYIDTEDMVASQVCGQGCLPTDAHFVPGDMGHIQQSYSYDELVVVLEY